MRANVLVEMAWNVGCSRDVVAKMTVNKLEPCGIAATAVNITHCYGGQESYSSIVSCFSLLKCLFDPSVKIFTDLVALSGQLWPKCMSVMQNLYYQYVVLYSKRYCTQ